MERIIFSDINQNPFLIDWLKDSAVAKTAEILDKQLQEIEDCLQDMFFNLYLERATKYQLDVIGKILDLDRNGFDDDSYRSLLRVKANTNSIAGSPEAVISTVRGLIGNDNFQYVHEYPAKTKIITTERFKIYVWYNFITDDGSFLVLKDGVTGLSLREQALNSADIVMRVIPSGVDLEIATS